MPRVNIGVRNTFIGKAGGAGMELDMRDETQRKSAIRYLLAIFLPPIICAVSGFLIGNALGNWLVGIILGGLVGAIIGLLLIVSLVISDREKDVVDSYVTYFLDTQKNTFYVKDAYGRDVTQYYGWRTDWTTAYRLNSASLMKFHVKKIHDYNLEQPEIVDDRIIQAQIDELKALRFIIWGIAACFTFIPFLPCIVFAQGEKRYPDTKYFRKMDGLTYKQFGLLWSVVSLVVEIIIVIVLSVL